MTAQLLAFPCAPETPLEAARIELAMARDRLRSTSEALDARNSENWECFQWARERATEAEKRLREVDGSVDRLSTKVSMKCPPLR